MRITTSRLTKPFKTKSRRVVDTIIDHSRCDAVVGGARNDIAIETISVSGLHLNQCKLSKDK